jgi:hypothetical protein
MLEEDRSAEEEIRSLEKKRRRGEIPFMVISRKTAVELVEEGARIASGIAVWLALKIFPGRQKAESISGAFLTALLGALIFWGFQGDKDTVWDSDSYSCLALRPQEDTGGRLARSGNACCSNLCDKCYPWILPANSSLKRFISSAYFSCERKLLRVAVKPSSRMLTIVSS